ncbi:hypothetical protein J6590_064393 [Homalodisca vitripennis]|nr:hypothetical protein J6590_064393 [Homalodisca vitripennis]
MVYTYQLNPPLGTAKTDVPHFNPGNLMDVQVHGQFDRSSLLWEMTVGVGGICSLTSEGVPPPAYFDWRGWFRAGLPFFWGDMTLRCSALILPNGSQQETTEVWGLKFKNPVGMAAGFDKQGEAVEGLHGIGFGFVEIGCMTPNPQPGNEKPSVFRLVENSAVINRYGFNSDEHDKVYERLQSLKQNELFRGVIGVNLGKNKDSIDPVDDYIKGIEKFGHVADYIVINISRAPRLAEKGAA